LNLSVVFQYDFLVTYLAVRFFIHWILPPEDTLNLFPLGDFIQAGPQEVELEKSADVHARLQMQGRIVKHEDGNPLDFLLSDLGPIKARLGCIAKGAPVAKEKRQESADENYGGTLPIPDKIHWRSNPLIFRFSPCASDNLFSVLSINAP
jgi:hypothetical protein